MLLMSSMSVRACWRTLDETLTGWPLGAILAAIACQLWKRRRAVLSSSFVNGQLCDCKIRLNRSRTFSIVCSTLSDASWKHAASGSGILPFSRL